MRLLEEHDSGKTVEIDLGSTFAICLSENPTTGYRWIIERANGMEPLGDSFAAGTAVGEAGFRVFQFRASSVGSHDLKLESRRVWQGKGLAAVEFVTKIVVK